MMRGLSLSSVPNIITLVRLILVPVAISAIAEGRWTLTFLAFVIAGLSDGIDGYLARRYDWRSRLGAYLDPIADKALLVSIYVALALAGVVPRWLAILVVSRDAMIVGGVVVSWLLGDPFEIRPLLVSKLNTAAQIGFAAAVLGGKAFDIGFGLWFDVAVVAVAGLTLASAAAYLNQWLGHVTD